MFESDVREIINDIMNKDMTEDEKKKIFKEFSEIFLKNIDEAKSDILKTKEEDYKDIEVYEKQVNILNSLEETIEIKELKQKEVELIKLTMNELSWLDSFYSYLESFEKVLHFIGGDIIYYPEKIKNLQLEIDLLNKNLRKKGIIKG